MGIKIIQSGSSKSIKPPKPVDPAWQHWMDESVYDREQARRELGLANGTFYRRIARPPTLIERLAMAALFEGLEPFGPIEPAACLMCKRKMDQPGKPSTTNLGGDCAECMADAGDAYAKKLCGIEGLDGPGESG